MKVKKKIKRSIARRFKVTKNGKLMFEHQFGSHKKLNKSKRRLRRQKEPAELTGKFAQNIKKMLGAA